VVKKFKINFIDVIYVAINLFVKLSAIHLMHNLHFN